MASNPELENTPRKETYQVIFRHLNCRRRPQSEDSPCCEAIIEWFHEASQNISSESQVALNLLKIARELHRESEGYTPDLHMEMYIVWNRDLPTTVRGEVRQAESLHRCELDYLGMETTSSLYHQTHLDPRDLELVQQRNCGDFVLVEFTANYSVEDERRGRMLNALQKLAKRASRGCNR
ncbi:hypothetical protein NPX13_g11281 [Xylaria arbuscula]|uniref:Uncharacterized protein n=1 Tax=Xylaria arbuscula TaxID=114810 RepID=A0A9W8N3F5_9PEZI|nr:hypothetical protein NPX13_g11281 [Xylaria arbuscula]